MHSVRTSFLARVNDKISIGLLIIVLCLFISTTCSVKAQQNLFNIPSGDITPKSAFFYQHQINAFSTSYIESKSHFVWGLGSGWDVGVNLINLKLNPLELQIRQQSNGSPSSPLPLLTVQKQFVLSEYFHVNIGTQAGIGRQLYNITNHFTHFTYGIVRYDVKHALRLVGGIYATDNRFIGKGNTLGGSRSVGILAGFELPITHDVYLMGDYVSGNHSSAVSVIGGMVNVSKRVQICAGYLLPNNRNVSLQGIVLELNILGYDLD